MTHEEMLKQLESLRDNSADMARGEDEPGVWHHDVVALEMALDILQEKKDCVMVLPCPMGTTIYMIVTKHTKDREPFSFIKTTELMESNVFRVCRDYGKTVFLSRESAERALKGGQST